MQPRVGVRDRENVANFAETVIHGHTYALLHINIDDTEAVAYVVGQYCGLDTSGSAFYLAAWESDDPEIVRNRLDRISPTAEELIDVLEDGV